MFRVDNYLSGSSWMFMTLISSLDGSDGAFLNILSKGSFVCHRWLLQVW